MVLPPAQINQILSVVALYLGIAWFGVYLSGITWYWLLPQVPALSLSHIDDVQQVDSEEEGIPLTETMQSIQAYNPWGEIPKIASVAKKPAKQKIEKAVETKLNVKLVGTMVQEGMQSVAFLMDLGSNRGRKRSGKQQMMYVGDHIQAAVLEKIERNAVYLRNGKRLEVVRLESELLERKELLPDHLKSTKVNDQQIARKEWHKMIDKGVSLLRGLEITPYYQGRHAIGYRVNIIAPRPIYKQAGITSGDIIKTVNGHSVMRAKEILATLPQLKQASQVKIEILRNHKPETLVLHIGS